MTEFFYWSGVVIWSAIAACLCVILWILVKHSVTTAIFTKRVIDILGMKTGLSLGVRISTVWRLYRQFFVDQPYNVRTETDVVYWPGREKEEERFPG